MSRMFMQNKRNFISHVEHSSSYILHIEMCLFNANNVNIMGAKNTQRKNYEF